MFFLTRLLLSAVLTVHVGMEMSRLVRDVELVASLRHGHGLTTPIETTPAAKSVPCYTTSRISIVCMAVVVSVAVVFIIVLLLSSLQKPLLTH